MDPRSHRALGENSFNLCLKSCRCHEGVWSGIQLYENSIVNEMTVLAQFIRQFLSCFHVMFASVGRTDGLGTEVCSSLLRVIWMQARRSLALSIQARGVGIGSGGGREGKFGWTPCRKGGWAATAGLTSPPLTWVADDLKQAWGWVGLGANSVGCCLEEASPKFRPGGSGLKYWNSLQNKPRASNKPGR